ncbi:hypothetical protein MTsPCn9_18610 [Croceitalea sp. MTPC9]|uniref:hypothetical protein n=1 Tax=unclassified Croceitalea TaxID=2632280 RepID=UPI002B3E1506|nr:hypothetical protein MTsPCn6_11460 [Croceitalea sp. MTPC6]GMN16925.1 hypothetical protein MTsPCn9_18610 [Croceitalea sp. MTPC9]
MKHLYILLPILFLTQMLTAQQNEYFKKFEHFTESRGNMESGLIITLPYQERVRLEQGLNSNSDLGPRFNYFGTVVIVDQMDVLPNGTKQLILRREDGRNFYGYTAFLKATLSNENIMKEETDLN